MNTNEIKLSFKVLNDVLDEAINNVNVQGSIEFANGEYTKADVLLKRANEINSIQENLNKLETDVEKILVDSLVSKIVKDEDYIHISKRFKDRLKYGLRTPQRKYRLPILEALIKCDGREKTGKVLSFVFELMKDKLNEHDLILIRANEPRWRNAAMWERKNMVLDGLLSDKSPNGIWEITQDGMKHYNSMHNYLNK